MKIYTKGGDQGETGLFGGDRVSKGDLRIEAYGAIDELNAQIGLSVAIWKRLAGPKGHFREQIERLERVQGELFEFGAELATPAQKQNKLKMSFIDTAKIETLESEIDQMEVELPPLKTFILPGGAEPAAALHLARTTCRRAERDLVRFSKLSEEKVRKELFQYLNRLSDYLFVFARYSNHLLGAGESPWSP